MQLSSQNSNSRFPSYPPGSHCKSWCQRPSSNPVFHTSINAQAHQYYMDHPNCMQSLRKAARHSSAKQVYLQQKNKWEFFFQFSHFFFGLNIVSLSIKYPSYCNTNLRNSFSLHQSYSQEQPKTGTYRENIRKMANILFLCIYSAEIWQLKNLLSRSKRLYLDYCV